MNRQGYPSLADVEQADQTQLIRWVRYLPSPDDDNRPILERILERQAKLREGDQAGYIQASKDVGWDG